MLGHAVAGGFTPVGGHDRTCSIRRVALDAALVETAAAAGAELRLGAEVGDIIGSGTEADPVRGVVLRGGERLRAPWVIGADGRTSTVARRLGLPASQHRRGEMAMLFAYWEGLPDSDWCQIDVHEQLALMSAPCEDGVHLLSVAGPADLTRGSAIQRQQTYLSSLRRFPAILNPRLLEQGRQVSPVVAVPETMLRGFVRPAHGPGWALVGDAGLFKHPVTAQGIGDALAQGWYVGSALGRGEDLDRLRDLARRPGRRPLRLVVRGRALPVGRGRGDLLGTGRRPRGRRRVPRHLHQAASPERGADADADGALAGRLGVRGRPARARQR